MTRPPPGIEQPHMLGEKTGGSLRSGFISRSDSNFQQRDLFPLPLFGADPIASKSLSRSCRRRLLSTAHWQKGERRHRGLERDGRQGPFYYVYSNSVGLAVGGHVAHRSRLQ